MPFNHVIGIEYICYVLYFVIVIFIGTILTDRNCNRICVIDPISGCEAGKVGRSDDLFLGFKI